MAHSERAAGSGQMAAGSSAQLSSSFASRGFAVIKSFAALSFVALGIRSRLPARHRKPEADSGEAGGKAAPTSGWGMGCPARRARQDQRLSVVRGPLRISHRA